MTTEVTPTVLPRTTVPASASPIPPWLGRSDVHVVPAQGNWAIKQEHLPRYTGLFETQYEAIAGARLLAIQGASSMVIHNRLGQFRDVRTYR